MSYKIITTVSKVVNNNRSEVTLVGYVGSRIKMYREQLGLKQIDVSRKNNQPDGSCNFSWNCFLPREWYRKSGD
jgi:transcription antitermination factor NusA-like protein